MGPRSIEFERNEIVGGASYDIGRGGTSCRGANGIDVGCSSGGPGVSVAGRPRGVDRPCHVVREHCVATTDAYAAVSELGDGAGGCGGAGNAAGDGSGGDGGVGSSGDDAGGGGDADAVVVLDDGYACEPECCVAAVATDASIAEPRRSWSKPLRSSSRVVIDLEPHYWTNLRSVADTTVVGTSGPDAALMAPVGGGGSMVMNSRSDVYGARDDGADDVMEVCDTPMGPETQEGLARWERVRAEAVLRVSEWRVDERGGKYKKL